MQQLHQAATSTLLAFPSLWLVWISVVLQRWYIRHFGCCQRIHHRRNLVAMLAVFLIEAFDKLIQARCQVLIFTPPESVRR